MGELYATDVLTTLLDYQMDTIGITDENSKNIKIVLIDLGGIHYLVPEKGIMVFVPNIWSLFIDDLLIRNIQSLLPSESIDGIEVVFKEFIKFEARNAFALMQNNKLDCRQLCEKYPGLINNPIIKIAYANHIIENNNAKGSLKRGRPPKDNRGLLNLYGWASYYYYEGLSLTLREACERAAINHPKLIPISWKLKHHHPEDYEFEIAERLEKNMDRIQRQYPEYDLKEYREASNKK